MYTFLFQHIAVFKALLEIFFCNAILHCSTILKISQCQTFLNILRMNLILKTNPFRLKPVVQNGDTIWNLCINQKYIFDVFCNCDRAKLYQIRIRIVRLICFFFFLTTIIASSTSHKGSFRMSNFMVTLLIGKIREIWCLVPILWASQVAQR